MFLEDLKTAACQAIDAATEELDQLSQQIWSHPELNFEEHYAHQVLTDYLEKHGFPVERKLVGDTAFWASVGTDEGPNVAVLCEYDALPEIGHACGHNLIAEAGIGAGVGIKAALDAAGKTIGKLSVLGCPAEEGGGGKIDLLNAGVFDSVDFAMMVHPAPTNATGSSNFMCGQKVAVSYSGKASHAAGFPWEGVNALDAAIMAYNNVSCLRQQLKPTWRVHGIVSNGGAKPNIIPELASLDYIIRTLTSGELQALRDKIYPCFEAAALATGCKVNVEFNSKYYTNILNNPTMVKLYEDNAVAQGVQFPQDQSIFATPLGSTDMGNVSHVVPSIHPMYYIGSDAVNHTREFNVASGDPKAQPYTIQQAKAMACTSLDILCQPELLDQIKAEFHRDLTKDQEA